ncbi:interleukin-11 receptor subunit alpha isoform X2 [Melanotaenia boesemani]|uniref:interleukin-11 receptor subunit alpha isoform X2 n=1 Tax=Melanotaenia boesemani TaxID=1250792 RepID=UPI001C03EBAF|nr:interleukin-11 receptor subunit alpha isoform X2 [Melanotaenia boesemani]
MPGLLSSPVCLTVIWFLSLSLPPSCAQIQTDEVSGVQYGHLQWNVTLACGNSQIRIPVVWHLNNSAVLPWHKVTSDGRLVLLSVDQSAQGNYSCYDNSGLLLHSVNLRLGYPPGHLHISCRLTNHSHVRCYWRESVKTFLPATYSAFLMGKENAEWKACNIDVTHKHCDADDHNFYNTMHLLNVTETNALGSLSTYFQMRMFEQLKPDPPESVLVEKVEDFPQRLMVSWSYPSSWPKDRDWYTLKFQMRYRPQGSKYWSQIPTKENAVMIFDTLAGHLTEVEVRGMDAHISESQWSEWSRTIFGRPWEASTTPDPTVDPDVEFPEDFLFTTQPDSTTTKSYNVLEDEGNLALVILLVLFSMFILTSVLSLIFVVRMRRRQREHATKQELTSMVKMKAMPI